MIYKSARALIPNAIKQFIYHYGVHVDIYKPLDFGVMGHKDHSRIKFDDSPYFTGKVFIPSVSSKREQNSLLDNLNIFNTRSPRLYTDQELQLYNSSLVVVRDMGRVINYIIDSESNTIATDSSKIYFVYNVVPFNIIDSEKNQDEITEVQQTRHLVGLDDMSSEYKDTDKTSSNKLIKDGVKLVKKVLVKSSEMDPRTKR